MFEPVRMTRLRLVILERDERAVLRHLGHAGIMQLTRTPAGPDTAPLSPRNCATELSRLERLSARLENLRRSLELPPAREAKPVEMSLEEAEKCLRELEEQAGELLKRRQHLQERLAETTAVSEQISDFRGFDLPLDRPDESSFLHFVTGSLPAGIFPKLEFGGNAALLPLAERDGRQILLEGAQGGRVEVDRRRTCVDAGVRFAAGRIGRGNRGVGVKAIGDLLGHRSLEATCVYLRIDTDMLRPVGLPVPTAAAV